jgi:hypothetical protein
MLPTSNRFPYVPNAVESILIDRARAMVIYISADLLTGLSVWFWILSSL